MNVVPEFGLSFMGEDAPCECQRLYEQYRSRQSTYTEDNAELASRLMIFCARTMTVGKANYVVTYIDGKSRERTEYRAFVIKAKDMQEALVDACKTARSLGHDPQVKTVRAVRDQQEWDALRKRNGGDA